VNFGYALGLIVTAFICVAVSFVAWKRRGAPGASGLAFFMLTCAVWAGTYAMRWVFTDFNDQLFWLDASYFGVVFNGTAFLIFTLQYNGLSKYITRRSVILLNILPALTLLALWTDQWHGLFFGGLARTTNSILDGGPIFWIFVFYGYGSSLIGTGIFIRAFLRSSGVYRWQAGMVVFAACLPMAVVAIELIGFVPFAALDITPFIYSVVGLIYLYSLFGFRMMDVIPVARHALVERMADGMIVLDANRRLVDINPAARRMLEISDGSLGKPWEEVTNERLSLDLFGDMKESNRKEIRLSGYPGLDIEVQSLPLIDDHQSLTGQLLILHDITERKLTESWLLQSYSELEKRVQERTSDLKKANMELEKASRMKDEFLASMSHELRTPLTVILGFSDVLLTETPGPLTEKQKKSVSRIQESGQQLSELISDILDLSKLGAGKLGLSLGPISLGEVAQNCWRKSEAQATAKGLQFSYSISPQLVIVQADGQRLVQILLNLLSNAIKFTPRGGSIGIKIRGNQEEGIVTIAVMDTGIGIKPEDIPSLFQQFRQLDGSLARRYSGAGLGLVLAQGVTKLHCGTISVESEVDKGSCFTITLPWSG